MRGSATIRCCFGYRTFNSFVLGYLLLETSAMTLGDPKPGYGSYRAQVDSGLGDAVDAADAIPGALTPTRTSEDRTVAAADAGPQPVDPLVEVDPDRFPTVHRLAEGLSEDHYQEDVDVGLGSMLDRIEIFLDSPGTPHPRTTG